MSEMLLDVTDLSATGLADERKNSAVDQRHAGIEIWFQDQERSTDMNLIFYTLNCELFRVVLWKHP